MEIKEEEYIMDEVAVGGWENRRKEVRNMKPVRKGTVLHGWIGPLISQVVQHGNPVLQHNLPGGGGLPCPRVRAPAGAVPRAHRPYHRHNARRPAPRQEDARDPAHAQPLFQRFCCVGAKKNGPVHPAGSLWLRSHPMGDTTGGSRAQTPGPAPVRIRGRI